MNERFDEIKKRVIENRQTREDVLELLDMVETAEQELEDAISYALEEAEVQDMLFDDKGELF